jgi:chemotaxis protein CheD
MTSRQVLVRVARHAVGRRGDVLVTVGLGSCVAVALHDAVAGVGGLAHILLPYPSPARDSSNAFKFASTGVPRLVEALAEAGAPRRRLEARLVGGAGMFAALMAASATHVGVRNLEAVREALDRLHIPIRGEDVGGDWGRSVYFDVATGALRVTSVLRPDVVL